MVFLGCAADDTRIVFLSPCGDNKVKLFMVNIRHNFKIFKIIIKSVAINMMDYLVSFQFASKMLFHDPTMLKGPASRGGNFNLHITVPFGFSNPFGKNRKRTRVLQTPLCRRHLFSPQFHITWFHAALFAATRVTPIWTPFPFKKWGRITANLTEFLCHHVSIIWHQRVNCKLFMGAIWGSASPQSGS